MKSLTLVLCSLRVTCVLLVFGRCLFAAEFFGLGILPGDERSGAADVSADGSVVVGSSSGTGEIFIKTIAFRWTRETGMEPITSITSEAHALSGDGNVVAGVYWPNLNFSGRAFYWTAETGPVEVTRQGLISGASEDGSVLVGVDFTRNKGFRWTAETEKQYLDDSSAWDVSADGSVVVGPGSNLSKGFHYQAWRWTSETGTVRLGDPDVTSTAVAVSGDGSVVVGYFNPDAADPDGASRREAFRWTEDTGVVELASPTVDYSFAQDVSGDGSTVVGAAVFDASIGREGFIWTAENGMRRLQDVLIGEFGLSDSLAGWEGLGGLSISSDGNTIVGSGTNPGGLREAFLAYLGPTSDHATGDFDGDGFLSVADVNMLVTEIQSNRNRSEFDVNRDQFVNEVDLRYWIATLKNTWFGDANLDGQFDSHDLVQAFQAGEYEDPIVNNSLWASGDWNADGDFTTADLVLAFQDGGYEQGHRPATTAVPEPSEMAWLLGGLVIISLGRDAAGCHKD
jgi:uncharacterized membrane protein